MMAMVMFVVMAIAPVVDESRAVWKSLDCGRAPRAQEPPARSVRGNGVRLFGVLVLFVDDPAAATTLDFPSSFSALGQAGPALVFRLQVAEPDGPRACTA